MKNDPLEDPASKKKKTRGGSLSSAPPGDGMDWIDQALAVGMGGKGDTEAELTAEDIAAKKREEVRLRLGQVRLG